MDFVSTVQEQWRRERPELDVSPIGVIGRLHRIAGHLTRELVALYAEFGLSEGEFDVLASLRREGEPFKLAAGELAERTLVTTGGLTKRLDRLEARGLVERRVCPADGRGRSVSLTPVGRELIDDAFRAHMANEQRLLSTLQPSEVRQLTSLLATWAERSGL